MKDQKNKTLIWARSRPEVMADLLADFIEHEIIFIFDEDKRSLKRVDGVYMNNGNIQLNTKWEVDDDKPLEEDKEEWQESAKDLIEINNKISVLKDKAKTLDDRLKVLEAKNDSSN